MPNEALESVYGCRGDCRRRLAGKAAAFFDKAGMRAQAGSQQ